MKIDAEQKKILEMQRVEKYMKECKRTQKEFAKNKKKTGRVTPETVLIGTPPKIEWED